MRRTQRETQCVLYEITRRKGPLLVSWLCMLLLSHFSHVQLCGTLWTVALQAPLSMGFSRQEYWSGLPRPPPGDLPNPGIETMSHVSCIGRQVL